MRVLVTGVEAPFPVQSSRSRGSMALGLIADFIGTVGFITMTARTRGHGEGCQRVRCGCSPCRAVKRSARRAERRHNLKDQPPRLDHVGAGLQGSRCPAFRLYLLVLFDGCAGTFGAPSGDNRSYRTSFDKIRGHLPEFRCQWPAEIGARQLRQVFHASK
jgi:hypothetical protein